MSRGPTYYHGGVRGLQPGGLILPPAVTGARSIADLRDAPAELRAQVADVHSRDRVYLTTELAGAMTFAALHPSGGKKRGGDVYLVQPIGGVDPDPDWHGPPGQSVCCVAARVLRIVVAGQPRRPVLEALAGRST